MVVISPWTSVVKLSVSVRVQLGYWTFAAKLSVSVRIQSGHWTFAVKLCEFNLDIASPGGYSRHSMANYLSH